MRQRAPRGPGFKSAQLTERKYVNPARIEHETNKLIASGPEPPEAVEPGSMHVHLPNGYGFRHGAQFVAM